jgi:hypothetical protein
MRRTLRCAPALDGAPTGAPVFGLIAAVAAALLASPLPASAAPQPKAPGKICIEGNAPSCAVTVTPTPTPANGIKWHPGHYMMIRGRHKSVATELAAIDQTKGDPTVKGVLLDWFWNELEGDKGVYNFAVIDTYLKEARSAGKQMIIRVKNRAFGGHGGAVVPQYLMSGAGYNGGQVDMASGTVARIWEAPVMDRLIALHQALAARYDSDPNVEGISTDETAIGFGGAYKAPSSYSGDTLLTQLERYIAANRSAWSHSNVFAENNYLGSNSQMEEFIKFCQANRAIIGGPDVVPGRALQADQIMRGELGSGTDYRGTIAIKAEIQASSLGVRWTLLPVDLFANAVTQDRANFVFWDRNDYAGGAEQRWLTGILPFIHSVNGASVATCPSSWQNSCTVN